MGQSTIMLLIFLVVIFSYVGLITWAIKTRRINKWHGLAIGGMFTAITVLVLGQVYLDQRNRESIRRSIQNWPRTHPGVPRRNYE